MLALAETGNARLYVRFTCGAGRMLGARRSVRIRPRAWRFAQRTGLSEKSFPKASKAQRLRAAGGGARGGGSGAPSHRAGMLVRTPGSAWERQGSAWSNPPGTPGERSGALGGRAPAPGSALKASESVWECLGATGERLEHSQGGPRSLRKRRVTWWKAPGDGTDRGGATRWGFELRVLSFSRTSGSCIRAAGECLLSAIALRRCHGREYWAGSLSARPDATGYGRCTARGLQFRV